MAEVTYYTKEGLEKLKQELHRLKTTERTNISKAIAEARDKGDLSENAEYHEARAQQAEVEERISKLEDILKNSTVVEDRHGEYVMIGSTVTVEKKGGVKRTFMIVGSAESDMNAGKISNRSPLGTAVLGKKKGDTFTFNSPSGKMEYKVLEVK